MNISLLDEIVKSVAVMAVVGNLHHAFMHFANPAMPAINLQL